MKIPVLVLAVMCLTSPPEAAQASILIRNVRIVDGRGGPSYTGAVRIEGGRIATVGPLAPSAEDVVVDGGGKTLAPGFIDTHSHHDEGLEAALEALPVVSQGITTIIVGQDGSSRVPLEDYFRSLRSSPPAVNVASLVGHGSLREVVLGPDYKRPATPEELTRMSELLRRELAAGGIGLSTGLEYDPGIYATTDELLALAKTAAAAEARYVSHVRSEDRHFWEAIDEVLTVGRAARLPVHISHLKLAMRSLWGQVRRLKDTLDAARRDGVEVTADVYPYTYWQSTMTVLFPERDFASRETALFAVKELAPAGLSFVAEFDARPDYVGKSLEEVARLRGGDAADALMALIELASQHRRLHGVCAESIIATSMSEEDVQELMGWQHANVGSDGYLTALHPRGRGAFPRVLGRYAREAGLMPLEVAVHKMTGLAARNMGIVDRGLIAAGQAADLVLLDPERVIDHASPADPYALSTGVDKVFVNGVLVFESGKVTGERPGQVIVRPVGARILP